MRRAWRMGCLQAMQKASAAAAYDVKTHFLVHTWANKYMWMGQYTLGVEEKHQNYPCP